MIESRRDAVRLANSRVYVTGHMGMVGSAIMRRLARLGITDVVTRTRRELDLRDQTAARSFFAQQRPDVVIFAAARVGGIYANQNFPAQFLYDNVSMATNAIHAAYENRVERFLFLGSTCIYPRNAPQPMPEDSLLTSSLEPTNEAYALAKITGLKMCQAYRRQYGVLYHSAMPTNLYGPGDNYHPDHSHVLPAMIRRFHEAKESFAPEVAIWGTGNPRREFLHVDDLADAVIHLIELETPPDWVNVGTGKDISIRELAELVAEMVGYEGLITNDLSMPDGTFLKRTDTRLIESIGWKPKIGLREGIQNAYNSFLRELETKTIRVK
jgi:GDP-L-fucose synthase